uniref:Ribosomal protein L27 n=1 Tax=Trepomonas sp. PC1 TaxID=1076344 RepID=A0A146K4R5_9EUKA|eukprot:JAP90884.1 Ribosomal protein L27 [Trepomonas sp. PC1]
MSIFKPNTVCLVLQGRFAGKKCVVVEAHENLVTVVGINNLPKVNKSATEKQAAKAKMTTFIKVFHARHLMPTRYQHKQAFSNVVNKTALKDVNQKKKAVVEVTKKLTEEYSKGAEAWLFKKLAF